MRDHLADKRLSLRAKGLIEFALSTPNDFDCSIQNIAANNKENVSAIRSTIIELDRLGYLKKKKVKNQRGYFEYVYQIAKEERK